MRHLIIAVLLFLGGTTSLPLYHDIVFYIVTQTGAVLYACLYLSERAKK